MISPQRTTEINNQTVRKHEYYTSVIISALDADLQNRKVNICNNFKEQVISQARSPTIVSEYKISLTIRVIILKQDYEFSVDDQVREHIVKVFSEWLTEVGWFVSSALLKREDRFLDCEPMGIFTIERTSQEDSRWDRERRQYEFTCIASIPPNPQTPSL